MEEVLSTIWMYCPRVDPAMAALFLSRSVQSEAPESRLCSLYLCVCVYVSLCFAVSYKCTRASLLRLCADAASTLSNEFDGGGNVEFDGDVHVDFDAGGLMPQDIDAGTTRVMAISTSADGVAWSDPRIIAAADWRDVSRTM